MFVVGVKIFWDVLTIFDLFCFNQTTAKDIAQRFPRDWMAGAHDCACYEHAVELRRLLAGCTRTTQFGSTSADFKERGDMFSSRHWKMRHGGTSRGLLSTCFKVFDAGFQPPNVAQVNKTFAQHEARCPWLLCLGEQWVGAHLTRVCVCAKVCDLKSSTSSNFYPNFTWATASETGQFERCLHYIASRLMLLLSIFRKLWNTTCSFKHLWFGVWC